MAIDNPQTNPTPSPQPHIGPRRQVRRRIQPADAVEQLAVEPETPEEDAASVVTAPQSSDTERSGGSRRSTRERRADREMVDEGWTSESGETEMDSFDEVEPDGSDSTAGGAAPATEGTAIYEQPDGDDGGGGGGGGGDTLEAIAEDEDSEDSDSTARRDGETVGDWYRRREEQAEQDAGVQNGYRFVATPGSGGTSGSWVRATDAPLRERQDDTGGGDGDGDALDNIADTSGDADDDTGDSEPTADSSEPQGDALDSISEIDTEPPADGAWWRDRGYTDEQARAIQDSVDADGGEAMRQYHRDTAPPPPEAPAPVATVEDDPAEPTVVPTPSDPDYWDEPDPEDYGPTSDAPVETVLERYRRLNRRDVHRAEGDQRRFEEQQGAIEDAFDVSQQERSDENSLEDREAVGDLIRESAYDSYASDRSADRDTEENADAQAVSMEDAYDAALASRSHVLDQVEDADADAVRREQNLEVEGAVASTPRGAGYAGPADGENQQDLGDDIQRNPPGVAERLAVNIGQQIAQMHEAPWSLYDRVTGQTTDQSGIDRTFGALGTVGDYAHPGVVPELSLLANEKVRGARVGELAAAAAGFHTGALNRIPGVSNVTGLKLGQIVRDIDVASLVPGQDWARASQDGRIQGSEWLDVAGTAAEFVPVGKLLKPVATAGRTLLPARLGGGFLQSTTPAEHVLRIAGAAGDDDVLRASLAARNQLALTGKSQVEVGGRLYNFDSGQLDHALRARNPGSTLTSTAAPDIEKFAAGGEVPVFNYPPAKGGGVKPPQEQFQFLNAGAGGRLEFTRKTAFGGVGDSPGLGVYSTPLERLRVPGSPAEPGGVNFYHGRELELGVPAGGSTAPLRPVAGLGDDWGTKLYLDPGLAAPTYAQRVKANLLSLGDNALGRGAHQRAWQTATPDDIARTRYGKDLSDADRRLLDDEARRLNGGGSPGDNASGLGDDAGGLGDDAGRAGDNAAPAGDDAGGLVDDAGRVGDESVAGLTPEQSRYIVRAQQSDDALNRLAQAGDDDARRILEARQGDDASGLGDDAGGLGDDAGRAGDNAAPAGDDAGGLVDDAGRVGDESVAGLTPEQSRYIVRAQQSDDALNRLAQAGDDDARRILEARQGDDAARSQVEEVRRALARQGDDTAQRVGAGGVDAGLDRVDDFVQRESGLFVPRDTRRPDGDADDLLRVAGDDGTGRRGDTPDDLDGLGRTDGAGDPPRDPPPPPEDPRIDTPPPPRDPPPFDPPRDPPPPPEDPRIDTPPPPRDPPPFDPPRDPPPPPEDPRIDTPPPPRDPPPFDPPRDPPPPPEDPRIDTPPPPRDPPPFDPPRDPPPPPEDPRIDTPPPDDPRIDVPVRDVPRDPPPERPRIDVPVRDVPARVDLPTDPNARKAPPPPPPPPGEDDDPLAEAAEPGQYPRTIAHDETVRYSYDPDADQFDAVVDADRPRVIRTDDSPPDGEGRPVGGWDIKPTDQGVEATERDASPQVPDDVAEELRRKAEQEGGPVSTTAARTIEHDLDTRQTERKRVDPRVARVLAAQRKAQPSGPLSAEALRIMEAMQKQQQEQQKTKPRRQSSRNRDDELRDGPRSQPMLVINPGGKF